MGTGSWVRIPDDEVSHWNEPLRRTDAHLQQYPYWNEPLRHLHMAPQYLKYVRDGEDECFLCLLQLRLGPLRIGLIRFGPVSLIDGQTVTREALSSLREWARTAGFAFIRISHSEPGVIMQLAAEPDTYAVDAFPFYPHHDHELHIAQYSDEARTLATFQPVARRQIRNAVKLGYHITTGTEIKDLREVRDLFGALEERKGTVYSRPLGSYVELLRLASPYGAARVYTAWLNDRPVQSALVVRDRDVAHYLIGALDVKALGDHQNQSPGCLVHWTAMRDFYQDGVRTYDLGSWGSEGLPVFKRKFRPNECRFAGPLTIVQNRRLYGIWRRALPVFQRVRGPVRQLAGRISAT